MTQFFEHGYAVLIGVDSNMVSHLALPTVKKDVQAIQDVLTHPQRCGYLPDNVKVLLGSESTRNNVFNALFWLQEKVAADPEATAVIYYSGHGMADKATNQYYLLPYDIESLRRVRSSAIEAGAFNSEIAAIDSRRLLVLLDCCHADGMAVKSVESQPASVDFQAFPIAFDDAKGLAASDSGTTDASLLGEGQGRAILNSSSGAEPSYVRSDGAMSVFTYHLIEALTGHAPHEDGDKTVDVATVMSYVTRHVKTTIQSMGKAQTPVMRTSGVFPIANLLGGGGISKGVLEPPDPLAPLPEIVAGTQITMGDQAIAAAGENSTVLSGGGDVAGGNLVRGDVTEGDRIEATVTGSTGVAIGRHASSTVTINHGPSDQELTQLFEPLLEITRDNPVAVKEVEELRAEVEKGDEADDGRVAGLIEGIAAITPAAVEVMLTIFVGGGVASVAGAATGYVIGKLQKKQRA